MKPRSTEKPVARTPNTPEARSPSRKRLPSGARARTSSMAVTVTAVAPNVTRAAIRMFTASHLHRVGDQDAQRREERDTADPDHREAQPR
ncbi:hypothetical protein D3C74_360980 [compost metagenome]